MSNKLTFKDRDQYSSVFLEGRLVGRVTQYMSPRGWAYVPKGHGSRGEMFTTREEAKRSLSDPATITNTRTQ